MRHSLLRPGLTRPLLRASAVALAVGCASSCHDIDTRRVAPPPATLGDDIYGILCDRLGAGALAEDLTGASYHAVCHYTNDGKYADHVDVSLLPQPRSSESEQARALGVAKVETMARRRSDLIRAFNTAFPDIEIDNVATESTGDKIRLHVALMKLMQSIVPLYETDPYASGNEPLLPSTTRSLGRMFAAMMESQPAREAFSSIQGRRGYRPVQSALGVIRPALAYPNLRNLANAALPVVGPGGQAEPTLQQLLRVVKQELATSKPTVEPLAHYAVDPGTVQPNRPRSTAEVLGAILLAEHPSFEQSALEPARYIVKRDRHGFVIPFGNTPGIAGTVPMPFMDSNSDGFADVDPFGRQLVTFGAGSSPFVIPGEASFAADAFGRPEPQLYQYIDTSRTALGSVLGNVVPLVDAAHGAPPGDPDAWRTEHETLMYSLAGARVLFGPREEAWYDYATEAIHPANAPCAGCIPYERFRGEDSPIADLVHALGQVLADPDSDVLLAALIELVDNHPDTVARLMGASLGLREIALDHDALAAQGMEPFASLPYETPIWDEMAGVLARITARPGLLTKLLEALADDTLVTPTSGALDLGDAFKQFTRARDELTYDQNDVNGPARNLTDSPPSTLDPHNPVSWTQPMTGQNRSCLERTLKAIHDVNGVKACNKNGATVEAKVGILSVSWPLIGSYSECELFQFDNLGAFYLDSLLPPNHWKRSELKIKAGVLEAILSFLGLFVSTDELFEASSGITGLTLHPGPPALNRLVFFGASSTKFPAMPDHDFVNQGGQTDLFISSLIEPAPSSSCPKKANGVNECPTMDGTLRIADRNTIFMFERLGFYEYLAPLITVFADAACDPICDTNDYSGEQIFIDLVDILYKHWPNGKGQSYEPILVDAFGSDLLRALHQFAKVAVTTNITVRRGPKAGQQITGAEALELGARILFDPAYASQAQMVDRQGNKATKWVDGTPQLQLTGFTLFADALHKIDTRFSSACDCTGLSGKPLADCQAFQSACPADAEVRKGQWKRARSQLVDQFLAVDGEGVAAKFKNPGLPRMLSTILSVTREQLNANCSSRESGGGCDWAKKELGDKLATTLSGPLFAGLLDLTEALRADEAARRELERFLTYVLEVAPGDDARQATLATVADLLQVLPADKPLSPIFNSIAGAASPDDDPDGAGPASSVLKVLKALSGEEYDRYHVLDHILPGLVTPIQGQGGITPIEIIMDTISEINRIDASVTEPLDPVDYEAVLRSTRDFLTSDTRGLEQLYFIVQNRPRK